MLLDFFHLFCNFELSLIVLAFFSFFFFTSFSSVRCGSCLRFLLASIVCYFTPTKHGTEDGCSSGRCFTIALFRFLLASSIRVVVILFFLFRLRFLSKRSESSPSRTCNLRFQTSETTTETAKGFPKASSETDSWRS